MVVLKVEADEVLNRMLASQNMDPSCFEMVNWANELGASFVEISSIVASFYQTYQTKCVATFYKSSVVI